LWLAGPASDATFARVAELGDGWIPPPAAPPEHVAEALPRFRAALTARGRRPDDYDVATVVMPVRDPDGRADLERTLEEARRLGEAGVTVVSLYVESFGVAAADALDWIGVVGRLWHGE
jgi:alkanesulfonate monooxygenase SsuD/methylene tetrahydromethanopterin reductase-like flavin-dependent oxidoreductase (luciferase family)